MTTCTVMGCELPARYACQCKRCLRESDDQEKYFSCGNHLEAASKHHHRVRGRASIWFALPTPAGVEGQEEYAVKLQAQGFLDGTYYTRAKNKEDAKAKAKANLGNIEWKYVGLIEDRPVDIEDVTLIGSKGKDS